MGCTGSKVQNEAGISRCRARKRTIKHAVRWRNQYALAHTDYLASLKNLGGAFKQFTDGEFRDQLSSASSSSASASSASSTPVPATPTTPPLKNSKKPEDEEDFFVEEIVRRVKLRPMALRSKPADPITVVLPKRGGDDDDAYQRYMEADAPPDGLYSDIPQPGKPRGTAGGTSSASVASAYPVSDNSDYYSGYNSAYMMQQPDSAPSWDIFGIFAVPSMMHPFQQVVEEDEEELKRAMEEEDIPALEMASPPHRRREESPPPSAKAKKKKVAEEEEEREEAARKKAETVEKEGKLEKAKKKMVEEVEKVVEKVERLVERAEKGTQTHKPEKKDKQKEIVVEEEPEMDVAEEPPPEKFKFHHPKEEDQEHDRHHHHEAARDMASSSGTSGDDINFKIETEGYKKLAEATKSLYEEDEASTSYKETDVEAEAPPPPPPPLASLGPKKDRELWDVLRGIEKELFKASSFGSDVSRLLEARKNHSHSFLDTRGLTERSARIFRAMSRSQFSPRSHFSWSEDSSSDDFAGSVSAKGGGGGGSGHATTLDKLYAWEKKLYVEVKENDSISAEFERKCKLLKKLDARGARDEAIDKTRVAIKMLETQMQVSMQAMKATSQSIQEVTDRELFQQLKELLEATMIMWKNMDACHQRQKNEANRLKGAGSSPLEATSNSHKQATVQLEVALNEWQRGLASLVTKQKEYLRNLNSWLRLSIYTPDRKSDRRPPVQALCQAWTDALERLQEQELVEAIKSFAEKIHNIVRQQEDETRAQKRAESMAKELSKKSLALNNLEKKLAAETNTTPEETLKEKRDALQEKRDALEAFRQRVDEERDGFTRAMQITRKMTVGILEMDLPVVFSRLAEFSSACSHCYRELEHKSRNNELDTTE
ncbi:nitrate regulatory gene2 protein [Selaginella moellendorffii]|uniref:nitrate regulatory gene2 protein n=1 Tax=Selaginella moellendorffii TaxID=88036 RepID=UPI000D1C73AD|nr:nitrate regulatory gene2 protein [Selaginella moellendorffii]|eukprot:XP_024529343.1 nitrate regulatory gene2 protein [Selaginella moellendorffii]